MNQIDWQLVTTLVCVAAAVYFLGRRVVRFFRQRTGCAGGSCNGCDSGSGTAETPDFVSLDQLKSSK